MALRVGLVLCMTLQVPKEQVMRPKANIPAQVCAER